MRLLVVEDEKKSASVVRKALQAEGFTVDVCHDGNNALAAAMHTPFDGIVLDIMLPGRDGLSVLRQLRELGNATPVLLLSARGEVNERVEGLNAGADDYLAKPFALAELVARARGDRALSVGQSTVCLPRFRYRQCSTPRQLCRWLLSYPAARYSQQAGAGEQQSVVERAGEAEKEHRAGSEIAR